MANYYKCDFKDCGELQRLPIQSSKGEVPFDIITINLIQLHICPKHAKAFRDRGLTNKPYIYDDAKKLMEFLIEIIDERIEEQVN